VRGLRWAALSFTGPPKLTIRLTVQANDAESAKALGDVFGKAAKALAADKDVRAALPGLEKVLPLLKARVEEDRLVLDLDDKALAALRPHVRQAIDAAERDHAADNLRQVLEAMHRHVDAHTRFPAEASFDARGQPLLSWRVHLLPHLGQAALYKEFHLDEPWDSPHNAKLIPRMPAVYRPANAKLAAAFRTTYLAPRGAETMFPGGRGLRVVDVFDGTSVTILLVDADDEHAVVWSRPEDLKYDAREPTRGLGARHGGKFMVGAADASVHFLDKDVERATLRALFTRSGGEVANWP
jgi:hypothetical protein